MAVNGAVAGVAGVAATAVLGLGGFYLSGAWGADATLPTTLLAFKQEGHREGCLKSLFGHMDPLEPLGSGVGEVGENDVSSALLGNDQSKITGCLVVNWDKRKPGGTGDNWSGNLRLLWAMKGDAKGFLVFLVGSAKEDNSEKKLDWEGVAYTAKHEKGLWKLDKKKEAGSGKKFLSTSDDNKFPKSGEALSPDLAEGFWEFMSQKNDMDKLVASKPEDIAVESRSGYWLWQGKEEGETELEKWTKDLSEWWKEIFGEDKWKMQEVLQNKKGKWTLKRWDKWSRDPEPPKAE